MKNINSLAHRAKSLHLYSQKLSESLKNGGFRAVAQGHGVEFSGVRDYLLGDDIRSIDWNVTARFGKPFVKTFEEEKELNVFLVVDRSLSMKTGTKRSREEAALETAALLLFASLQISSPVGAVFFDGKIQFSVAPKSGENHAMTIFSAMDGAGGSVGAAGDGAKEPGSVLPNALNGASKLLKKRSLVFVISDFRVKGWEKPLGYLAQKHDVVAIRIADSADSKLKPMGTILAQDSETGVKRYLPTSSRRFANFWLEENRRRVENWEDSCRKKGARTIVLSTDSDPVAALMRGIENA